MDKKRQGLLSAPGQLSPGTLDNYCAPVAPSSWRTTLLCLLVAVAAATIVTIRFSPRFVWWRALPIAGDLPLPVPDVDRAVATLAQLDNPWDPVIHPVHKVIGWRLLFPVVGHYLHLPHAIFLTLPHFGCVLALWFVAELTYRRLQRWWPTFVVTTLFSTLPWFVVSSGALAYFDSWLIISLVTAAFIPSRSALAAACLIAPWIDERFVLGLPATIATRAVALGYFERHAWRALASDLTVAVIASTPYPTVRLLSWLRGDASSTSYLRSHWTTLPSVPWTRFLDGLWSSYRVAWLAVVAGFFLIERRAGERWGLVCALIVSATAIGGLFIAMDMCRSAMMISPMLLLSMWLWEERRPHISAGNSLTSVAPTQPSSIVTILCRQRRAVVSSLVLPAILIANLTLPAYHVIWTESWPIKTLYTEIHQWRDPPAVFRAYELLREGRQLKDQGRLDDALLKFDAALRYESRYPIVLLERATIRLQTGDLDGAEADANAILRLLPDYAFALYLRGVVREAHGEKNDAIDDFRRAIECAPSNWEFRSDILRRLDELTRATPLCDSSPETGSAIVSWPSMWHHLR